MEEVEKWVTKQKAWQDGLLIVAKRFIIFFVHIILAGFLCLVLLQLLDIWLRWLSCHRSGFRGVACHSQVLPSLVHVTFAWRASNVVLTNARGDQCLRQRGAKLQKNKTILTSYCYTFLVVCLRREIHGISWLSNKSKGTLDQVSQDRKLWLVRFHRAVCHVSWQTLWFVDGKVNITEDQKYPVIRSGL